MNAETITDKLHAESDKKLQDFIQSRLGDLFQLCGGHGAERIEQESNSKVKQAAHQFGISPQKTIWHGSVWCFAEQTLFVMLRDKWRAQAVTEFLAKVERLSVELDEVRNIAENAAYSGQ